MRNNQASVKVTFGDGCIHCSGIHCSSYFISGYVDGDLLCVGVRQASSPTFTRMSMIYSLSQCELGEPYLFKPGSGGLFFLLDILSENGCKFNVSDRVSKLEKNQCSCSFTTFFFCSASKSILSCLVLPLLLLRAAPDQRENPETQA